MWGGVQPHACTDGGAMHVGGCSVHARGGGGDAVCTKPGRGALSVHVSARGHACAHACARTRVLVGPRGCASPFLSPPQTRRGHTHTYTPQDTAPGGGGTRGGGGHPPASPALTNPSSYSGPRRRPRRAPSRRVGGFCRPTGRGLSYQCWSQRAALRGGRGGARRRRGGEKEKKGCQGGVGGPPTPCARTQVAVGGHGDERGVLVLLAPGFVGPIVVAQEVEGALVEQLHAQVPCRSEGG